MHTADDLDGRYQALLKIGDHVRHLRRRILTHEDVEPERRRTALRNAGAHTLEKRNPEVPPVPLGHDLEARSG